MATWEKSFVKNFGSVEEFAKQGDYWKIYESDDNFHTVKSPAEESSIFSSPYVNNPRVVWEKLQYRAGILMILRHTEAQRTDVATAAKEFIASHPGKVSGKPTVTFTHEGSTVDISLVTKDADEAMVLNEDLKRRMLAYGIPKEHP